MPGCDGCAGVAAGKVSGNLRCEVTLAELATGGITPAGIIKSGEFGSRRKELKNRQCVAGLRLAPETSAGVGPGLC
jgi:hypothetical protein